MSTEHEASRTLVKSPPELWAECSDAGSLARHLGEFGEIRITRLEPETTVAWEGERASGTVRIEPSGWGTRVTLTAQTEGEPVVEEAATVVEATDLEEPDSEEEADAKVETTPAEPDPALEANAAQALEAGPAEALEAGPAEAREADPTEASRRFRRLIARTRAVFRGRSQPFEASSPEVDSSEPAGAAQSQGPPEPPEAAEPPQPTEAAEHPPPAEAPEASQSPDPPNDVERREPPQAEHPEAPEAEPSLDPEAVLAAALDSLGQAHHRPFSRA